MNGHIQGFPLDIHLIHRVGETIAHLSRSFYYIDKDGVKHNCPSRMVTDGLSIPRKLWFLFGAPFASPYLAGGLVHDGLCDQARDIARDVGLKQARQLRLSADKLFHEMLLFLGCPRLKAWAMFRGVRIGSVALRWVK